MSRFVSRRTALAAVITGAAAAALPLAPALAAERRTVDRGASATTVDVFAPVSGEIVALEDVPDVMFAEKLAGDGIAVRPTDSWLRAPVDGVIGKIYETDHAFTIESDEGLEVLVHFGIDTAELKGEGFRRIAEEGKRVARGDIVIELDLPLLEERAKSTLTPVVISNMERVTGLTKSAGSASAGWSTVLKAVMA
ncbi:PTS glucose transporter subunit IIA [Streptomyces sp. NPDC059258]|uniref:PTS glucose transporter subunit IIA n=1 Tax=unclassified Streptomyces TaxID=2593676 RepID=UPI0036CF5DD7